MNSVETDQSKHQESAYFTQKVSINGLPYKFTGRIPEIKDPGWSSFAWRLKIPKEEENFQKIKLDLEGKDRSETRRELKILAEVHKGFTGILVVNNDTRSDDKLQTAWVADIVWYGDYLPEGHHYRNGTTGTAVLKFLMERLCAFADQHGLQVHISDTPYREPSLSVKEYQGLLKQLGFEVGSRGKRPSRFWWSMVRQPQR